MREARCESIYDNSRVQQIQLRRLIDLPRDVVVHLPKPLGLPLSVLLRRLNRPSYLIRNRLLLQAVRLAFLPSPLLKLHGLGVEPRERRLDSSRVGKGGYLVVEEVELALSVEDVGLELLPRRIALFVAEGDLVLDRLRGDAGINVN